MSMKRSNPSKQGLGRRDALIAGSSGITILLAGCIEEFSDSDDTPQTVPTGMYDDDAAEMQEQDDRGWSEDDVVMDDDDGDDTDDSYSDEETQTGSSEQEANELEDGEERTEILELYIDSINSANQGTQYSDGILDKLYDEEFQEAKDLAAKSEEKYDQSLEKKDQAIDLTYEVDEPEAREIIEEAEQYVRDLRDSARSLSRSARAGLDGNIDRQLEYAGDASDAIADAERRNPRDSTILESVLDL